MARDYDVLILGYYGFGNLGDELLAEASLSLLDKNGIRRERIALLCADPSAGEKKFGVRCIDRWNLKEIFSACRKSRSLLLGGGGLFQESTSLRSCVYYWAVVRIAHLCGCKLWAEGQSIGPLRTAAAKFFAKSALLKCVHLTVRDEASQRQADELGLTASMTPDLVMSLQMDRSDCSGSQLLFNARPGYGELAEETARLAAQAAQDGVLGIIGIALSDEDVSEIKRLNEINLIKTAEIIKVETAVQFAAAARSARAAIGMRLHFAVLSALCGLPAAAASYDPKVAGFCARFGVYTTEELEGIPCGCDDAECIEAAAEEAGNSFRDGLVAVLGD